MRVLLLGVERLPATSYCLLLVQARASPETDLSVLLSGFLSFLHFSCSDESDQGGKIKWEKPGIQGKKSGCGNL